MKSLRDSNYDDVQRKDARFISGIMKAKAHLGFGVNTSNKNKNQKTREGALERVPERVPEKVME